MKNRVINCGFFFCTQQPLAAPEQEDAIEIVSESAAAPSSEPEIIEAPAPAPSKPLSWADRIAMNTPSVRSAAPPAPAAKVARSVPAEQVRCYS